MIEGLKLDVRAEELVARLDERAAAHQAKVDAYSAQLRRLGDLGPDPEDDDAVAELRGHGSPRHSLERKHQQHSERVVLLTFLAITSCLGRSIGSARRICDSQSSCPIDTGGEGGRRAGRVRFQMRPVGGTLASSVFWTVGP